MVVYTGYVCFFFFFQAEDGIRDGRVTGVQTCALVVIVRPMVGRVRRRSREQADQRGELTSLVSELVGSIKLVRAYVAEAFEAQRFHTLANRYRKGVLRAQRYALLTSPVSEVFSG